MNDDFEFIVMEQVPAPGRKSSIWRVKNRRSGGVLGRIQWYGAWRQYCYFPEGETVYSAGCLADIVMFIHDANKAHRDMLELRHSHVAYMAGEE